MTEEQIRDLCWWMNRSMRAQKTSKCVYLGSISWCGATRVSVANCYQRSNADVSPRYEIGTDPRQFFVRTVHILSMLGFLEWALNLGSLVGAPNSSVWIWDLSTHSLPLASMVCTKSYAPKKSCIDSSYLIKFVYTSNLGMSRHNVYMPSQSIPFSLWYRMNYDSSKT